MDAGLVCRQRADACWIHFDRVKIVERNSQIVQQRRPDRLGMADNGDRPVGLIVTKLLQMLHHPALNRSHIFAMRRTTRAPPAVPAFPAWIVVQFAKERAGPSAEIDFIDG